MARGDGRSQGASYRNRETTRETSSEALAAPRKKPSGGGGKVSAAVGKALNAILTGHFINTMWGEAGTALGYTQMWLIRLLMIWPLKAVAPIAYAYWARQMIFFLDGQPRAWPVARRGQGMRPLIRDVLVWGCKEILAWWMASEVFFVLFYLYKKRSLQEQARPPLMRSGAPLEVLRRSLAATDDIQAEGRLVDASYTSPLLTNRPSSADMHSLSLRKTRECSVEDLLRFHSGIKEETQEESEDIKALKHAEVAGWFLHWRRGRWQRWPTSRVGEICRGNLGQWMAWAFWNCEPQDVPDDRRVEMDQLIDEGSKWAGVDFREGFNSNLHAMRLTMDPIPSEYRPLIYYTVTALAVPLVTYAHLSRLGFTPHKSGTVGYWHKPGSDLDGPPFVFCHGVGVNLLPYAAFITVLMQQAAGRSIFLVSMPHISMRIKDDVPSSAEMVACLRDMLASWGKPVAHFVGHSFGSLLVAWMVLREPSMVSMATFMDPVCFLLIKPDVCFNFMYREPETPTQLLIHYFVSRELYIAHSLSRNFFWNQNLVWPEDLLCPALVVLSGQDSIVPAHSVRRYLAAFKRRRESKLRTLWFPELGHGEINFGPVGLEACKSIVSEMLLMEGAHKVVAGVAQQSAPPDS